jgi:hypothetical protein
MKLDMKNKHININKNMLMILTWIIWIIMVWIEEQAQQDNYK